MFEVQLDEPSAAGPSRRDSGPWLLWAVLGLILGLNVELAWDAPWLWLGLGLLLAGLAVLAPGPPWPLPRRVLLLLGALAIGLAWRPPVWEQRLVVVEAEVQYESVHAFGKSVRLQVDRCVTGRLPRGADGFLARISGVAPALRPGDRIRVTGLLLTREYRERTFTNLQVSAVELLVPRGEGRQAWAWRAIDSLAVHGELAGSLLLGRGRAPERDRFRDAGLLHLLAVSGLHVGLALLGVVLLMRWSGLPWTLRQGGLVLAALGYLWLTDASIPTRRAVVMVAVLVLYALTGRRPQRLAPLALAALVLIAWDASDARSFSFQLSLVAVAGIMTLGRDLVRLRQRWLPLQAWPLDRPSWSLLLRGTRGAVDGLLIGQAAGLAVLPLIACLGECNPFSALATVLATPPLVVVLVVGLAWLVLQGLWSEGPWTGLRWLLERGLELLVVIVEQAARLPGSRLEVERPSDWMLLLWPLLFLPLRDGRDLVLRGGAVVGVLLLW